MNKKIVWEHLHSEDEEPKQEESDMDENDSFDDNDDEAWIRMSGGEEPQKLINTPWGLFSVKDNFNPLKQFVWWVGHTNFTVGHKTGKLLGKIPGIEFISVKSRYRFMIAVGKAFTFSEVRKSIEDALKINSTNVTEQDDLLKDLNEKHEKWAILYFDDKTYQIAVDDEYESGMQLFKEYLETNTGKLITHNDV